MFPTRSARAAWRLVDGEVVIADPVGRGACVLNGAAGAAWRLADGSREGGEIAGLLGLDAEGRRALGALLDELAAMGLVERAVERAVVEEPASEPPQVPEGGFGEAPLIISAEPLEVLATVCQSTHSGGVGCRAEGACDTPFS